MHPVNANDTKATLALLHCPSDVIGRTMVPEIAPQQDAATIGNELRSIALTGKQNQKQAILDFAATKYPHKGGNREATRHEPNIVEFSFL